MLILGTVVVFVWLVQLLLALRILATVRPLTDIDAPPPSRWPRVSILVPARDEEAQIEGALASKLRATYPELELVAIDDRSRDATGAIIDRAAAADPRVRAVHISALPEGWLGKLNAMKRGLESSTGEWILLSDADVHVEAGVLERLISVAEKDRLDLIAVFPQMHSVDPVIDAAVVAFLRMIMFGGRVWSANDERSHLAAGVGAFNLVRKSVLESTAALDELKLEVADDVGLALLLKQSGARCRLYAGRSLVHLVYLDSLKAGIRSADKGGGLIGYSPVTPFAVAVLPSALDIGVPLVLLALGGMPAILGAIALLLGTLTHVVISAHFRGPMRGVLLWPVGQVLAGIVLMRAGYLAWKQQGIYWRDTFYSRELLEAGQRIRVPSLRVIRSRKTELPT